MLRLVTFALVSLTVRAGRATSASARAQQWMQEHNLDPNDQAGMNDLRASDPNAFAIVQALLAKQQLGLLDPKHPSANFAGAHKHHDEDSNEPSAVDILKSAPTVEAASSVPVSAVAMSRSYSSGSTWSFKPKQDDDALVANIMGDVTGVASVEPEAPVSVSTGSLISSSRSTGQSSALNGDMTSFGFGGQASMAEAMRGERPAPVTHASHRSAGFAGIPSLEWGNRYAGTQTVAAEQSQPVPVAAPLSASMSQEASSLTSMAAPAQWQQAAAAAPAQQVQASNPYLNGIDFSGDMPAKPKASMAQKRLKTRTPTATELASNPYLAGIDLPGVPAAQPQPEAPRVEASMSQQSSYLDQIGFPGQRRQRFQEEQPKSKNDNPLTSFSWHGEERLAAQGPPQTQMMQQVEEGVTQARISGPLSDWLSPTDGAPKQNAPRVITAQLQQPSSDAAAAVDPMAMDKYNDWVQGGQ